MPDTPVMTDQEFRLITELLNQYCGLHFAPERASAVSARLLPRLQETTSAGFLDYYRLLRYGGDGELQRAAEALTNHETYFFRELAQLLLIQHLVRESRRPLRILSAGCATGEEPYTLSILLNRAGLSDRADITAMDISDPALDRGRAARYSAHSFRGVDGEWIDSYFEPDEGLLRVREPMRDRVCFAQANLMEAAMRSALGVFDIVLCRNVTIYFDRASKVRAIRNLTDILVPGGYLFLGHSESLLEAPCAYEMIRAGSAIGYRKPTGADTLAQAGRQTHGFEG